MRRRVWNSLSRNKRMRLTKRKELKDLTDMGGKGDPFEIVQEI